MKKNVLNNSVMKFDLKKSENNIRKEMKSMEGGLRDEMERLENRVKLMIDHLKLDLVETNKQNMGELRAWIDPFLKEIQEAREDRALTTHRVAELEDRLDNHEERLKLVEQRH